jgi:hypothetical protein
MAFDWKKKLEEGKKIASAAFDAAADKAEELNNKYAPQIEAGVQKIEEKTAELAGKVEKKIDDLRKKPEGPQQ